MTVPSTFSTQMQSGDPKPLILIEIETGDAGTPWIRLSSDVVDTVWPTGGSTFTARPFDVDAVTLSSSDFPSMTLRCADADGYFNTWLATTTFRNKKLKRYVIEQDAQVSTDYAYLDVYRIQKRDRTDGEFIFTAVPIQALLGEYRIPRRTVHRDQFPGLPRVGLVT